jgi:drug/metabolite transporter (DMT)-like permease
MVIAAVIWLPYLLRSSLPRGRADHLRMLAVGTVGYALPLYLGTLGQRDSSATNAALLIGIEPVSIAVLSAFFLRERLDRAKAFSIAAGLVGGALIVSQGRPVWREALEGQLRGDVILFFHGICWALYSVIGKAALRTVDPLAFTGITTLHSLAAFSLARPGLAGSPSPRAVWALLYLAVLVTVVATVLWNKGLEKVPATRVAAFVFVQPLTGVLLGVLVGRERLTAWTLLGGALVLGGMYGSGLHAQEVEPPHRDEDRPRDREGAEPVRDPVPPPSVP